MKGPGADDPNSTTQLLWCVLRDLFCASLCFLAIYVLSYHTTFMVVSECQTITHFALWYSSISICFSIGPTVLHVATAWGNKGHVCSLTWHRCLCTGSFHIRGHTDALNGAGNTARPPAGLLVQLLAADFTVVPNLTVKWSPFMFCGVSGVQWRTIWCHEGFLMTMCRE